MILPVELIENINREVRKIPQSSDLMRLTLMQLSEQFTNTRAQLYLREGVMRRLGLLTRCVERIFQIHPPARSSLLSRTELDDLTINIQTFAINVYGILDNLAWICTLLAGVEVTKNSRVKIGLFKPDTHKLLPPSMQDYLASGTCRHWFENYAKAYRDSTAHRIPAYVPPTMFDPDEAEEYKTLQKRAIDALLATDVDLHNSLQAQADAMGRPSNIMLLTSSSEEDRIPEIPFHPQILCDWLTVHELLQKFVEGICQQFGYSVKKMPLEPFWNITGRVVGAKMDLQIKTPKECSAKQIEEFKSIVRSGNEVGEATLDKLVTTAFALAFIRDKQMIAVGALKHPNPEYRNKVFEKAKVAAAERFPLELGWIYVDENYRRRGFAGAIVAELVDKAGDLPIYATSAIDNAHMHNTLVNAGFEPAGHAYDSERRDRKLHLFLCE